MQFITKSTWIIWQSFKRINFFGNYEIQLWYIAVLHFPCSTDSFPILPTFYSSCIPWFVCYIIVWFFSCFTDSFYNSSKVYIFHDPFRILQSCSSLFFFLFSVVPSILISKRVWWVNIRVWLDITWCNCSNAQWSVGLNKSCSVAQDSLKICKPGFKFLKVLSEC